MKSRKKFLLRISPTLYKEMEAWAQQELRSVNGQIEYVLKEAVTRRRPSAEVRQASDSTGEESRPDKPASL